MKYKLELTSPPRDNQRWLVRGLVQTFMTDEPKPDTMLHPGMFQSCDTAESVIAGLHEELYGLLQTHGGLRDGDEFVSEACTANKYHGHDPKEFGSFPIPALRFVCEGIHVENRSSTT